MLIHLINESEGESEAVGAACRNAFRWSDSYNADIYCNPRNKNGMLEYLIVIKRRDDNVHRMTIGMVQRGVGAEFEFHS
jgi:hypothetical protein